MPARAIASGTISFGLVSIPVKLFSASQPQSAISFNLLHKKCGSRLKQQYICSSDGEKVEREDMIKGFEFSKDKYVQFTAEELKAIEEKSTQSIEISEFIPIEKIDPIYYDKPYYLGPDKGGDKAYRLLAEVMNRTGRAALAKYAARGKQYLVLLRPVGEGRIVMQQLLYNDEIKPYSEVPIPAAEVKEAEVKLATQLVDQISNDHFQPEKYEDEVRKRLHELINKKVEGQDITEAPAETGKAQIIDLMEALKQSLGKKPAVRAGTEDEESKPKRAKGSKK